MGKGIKYGASFLVREGGWAVCVCIYTHMCVCVCVCGWVGVYIYMYISSKELSETKPSVGLIPLQVFFFLCIRRLKAFQQQSVSGLFIRLFN